MKKKLLIILAIISALTVFGQSNATTDEGKKVQLNSDGTWEYIAEVAEEEIITRPISHVFVGGKKMTSGEKTLVHEQEDLATYISVAKGGEKVMIIFWQETSNSHMNFFDILWTGTVTLFLENGETILLMDRNIKGQNKISKGKNSSNMDESEKYQRFSAYYLTPAECFKLKQTKLSQIAHKTTSPFEEGTTYLELTDNRDTIREQLLAIKR